jgi:hypothetical protein
MSFIADAFDPPFRATLPSFYLDVLRPEYADVDYEAVVASANAIRGTFGPGDDTWPSPVISYEENLADLTRHEREFYERYAYAYVILDKSRQKYLGCVYLKPIKSKTFFNQQQAQFTAQAFLWLSVLHNLVSEEIVRSEVTDWLESVWGLSRVGWPGRTISWIEWQRLAECRGSPHQTST